MKHRLETSRVFEWLGRLGFAGVFDGRHRFELSSTPSGGTLLSHTEDLSGVLVRALRKSLDGGTLDGLEAMNGALSEGCFLQPCYTSLRGRSTTAY